MRALIVEDDQTSRTILEKYLKPYADCDVAIDGADAYKMFIGACKECKPYQLICLDIMMPEIDGHDVLRKIREYERDNKVDLHAAVKVIMVTALDDSMNVLRAFQEGCESYISKPIDKESLYHELRKLSLIE